MFDSETDERGTAMWEVLDCCGGHESIWTDSVGPTGDRRVMRFTSHELWCSTGQAVLDSRTTL